MIRFIIAFLCVFAAVFGFEFAFHGQFMKESYEQTAQLWRSMEEMRAMFHYSLIGQAALALVFTYLYKSLVKVYSLANGGKFGLQIGLLIAVLQGSAYAYMPVTQAIAISWFAGGIILGIIMGIVVGIVYRA